MENLPDHIIDKIADPAERKRHLTWNEAVKRDNHRRELRLHSDFSGFLKRHEDKIALVHHTNPTKRTRATVGEPDYAIHFMSGKTLFLEFKVNGNKLSEEQEKIISRLIAAGFYVLITGSYEEAIGLARSLF